MDLIRRLICTLVWTAQGPIFAICLDNMLTVNDSHFSRPSRILMWTMGSFLSGAIHAFAPPGFIQILSLFYQALYIGLLLWWCYRDRPMIRVTAMLLLYGIPAALDVPFSYIGTRITGLTPAEYYAEMDSTYVIVAISLQLTAIALQGIVCSLWCHRRKKMNSLRYIPILSAFSMIGLCIFNSGFFAVSNTYSESSGVYMTAASCFFFIICAAVFVLLGQAEKSTVRRQLAESRALAELEQAHYAAIEARREEMSQIRQSYNGILAKVLELLQSGAAGEAEKILNELSIRIAATREYPFCPIPVINAVLTEKQQQCKEYGIPFHADLLLPDTVSVSDLDLCSAFSNLMDNAIRVCRQETAPDISLSCRVIQGYLVIKCMNPSKKAPGGKPDNTGYGLKILRDIAARYQGNFFMEYRSGMVTAQLSLPVSRSQGGNGT